MPLFAALVVIRRHNRTEILTVPFAGLPRWLLVVQDLVGSLRAVRR